MDPLATADKTNNKATGCEQVEADSAKNAAERGITDQRASEEIKVKPTSDPGRQPSTKAPVYGLIDAGKIEQEKIEYPIIEGDKGLEEDDAQGASDMTELQPASNPPKNNYDQIGAGSIAQKKIEYPIGENDEGLFVIICNTAFNYTYNGIDLSKHKMDYTEDIKRIRNTFNLHGNQSNLLIRKELSNNAYGTKETNFDKFIDSFMTNEVLQDPKFLMFFLLSHGYEKSAEFLLAGGGGKDTKKSCCSEKKEKEHSKRGNCYARDIVKDVITKVQKSPIFSDVPKIFVIQTCRGIRDQEPKSGKSPSPPPDVTPADQYIPRGSDTLVLYSCIEAHKTWIKEKKTAGPFLVRNLCEAIDGVRNSVGKSIQMVSDLHESLATVQADQNMMARIEALNKCREDRGWANLLFCPEAFKDGWLTSVCQKTMADIVTFLEKPETKRKYVMFPSLHSVEQRPEVSSTLRYKVSMIKVLRTQWEKLYEDNDSEDMDVN